MRPCTFGRGMAPVKTNGRAAVGVELSWADTWVTTATISTSLRQMPTFLMLPSTSSQISKTCAPHRASLGISHGSKGISVLDYETVLVKLHGVGGCRTRELLIPCRFQPRARGPS